MARVRIKKLPKALSGLEIKMQPGLYGTNGNRQFTLSTQVNSQKFAQQPTEVRNTLQPVPRDEANLEAERGETAVVNIDGIPAHFKIGGKRHSQGGTPLNLPDNSFIFSDTAKMKIKDPNILAQFGMSTKKGGYTPAEIAKKYDINTYRKILADPNTEDVERKTAEMMISNYNLKLAKLGLAQESMKGFPQGIPVMAMPYVMANNINPADYFPTEGQEDEPDADTGEARYGGNMIAQFNTKAHGGMHFAGYPYYQDGGFWSNLGKGALAALEAPQRAMMYAGTGLFGDVNYEMTNPKTGQKEWIDEDIVKLKMQQGYRLTGEKKKAFYEMPGETIKRNFPQSSPWLQGAADVFADPFLVSGIAKTGARLATKKLIKETADAVVSGSMRGLTKEEMVNQIIKNAGKASTPKNVNIVSKSLESGAEALLKTEGKGAVKQAKAVEKAVAKTAGRARQVEDIKKAGQLTGKAGKFVYEKGLKPLGKGIEKVARKTGKLAVEAVEAARGPYAGPVVVPILKNVPGAVTSNIYKGEAQELKKQLQEERSKEKKNNYTPAGVGPKGEALFTDPSQSGKIFQGSWGNYTPYVEKKDSLLIKEKPNTETKAKTETKAEDKKVKEPNFDNMTLDQINAWLEENDK